MISIEPTTHRRSPCFFLDLIYRLDFFGSQLSNLIKATFLLRHRWKHLHLNLVSCRLCVFHSSVLIDFTADLKRTFFRFLSVYVVCLLWISIIIFMNTCVQHEWCFLVFTILVFKIDTAFILYIQVEWLHRVMVRINRWSFRWCFLRRRKLDLRKLKLELKR